MSKKHTINDNRMRALAEQAKATAERETGVYVALSASEEAWLREYTTLVVREIRAMDRARIKELKG